MPFPSTVLKPNVSVRNAIWWSHFVRQQKSSWGVWFRFGSTVFFFFQTSFQRNANDDTVNEWQVTLTLTNICTTDLPTKVCATWILRFCFCSVKHVSWSFIKNDFESFANDKFWSNFGPWELWVYRVDTLQKFQFVLFTKLDFVGFIETKKLEFD